MEIRFKIRKAKSQYLTETCYEIKELEDKYDTFDMYKRKRINSERDKIPYFMMHIIKLCLKWETN